MNNSVQSPAVGGEVRMVDVVTASSGLNISFSTFDKSREEHVSQLSEKVI